VGRAMFAGFIYADGDMIHDIPLKHITILGDLT
jgi:hypothetical protein